MLFKNIAILSLASFVLANEAAPVEHSENPEDIHKFKEEMMKKKCPKQECTKAIYITTTNTHTNWKTVTKTQQKQCAPTQQPKKNCGKQGC